MSNDAYEAAKRALDALAAENAALREALETIAEEHDAGRHDGLPEPCPAHEDYVMWLTARDALRALSPEKEG